MNNLQTNADQNVSAPSKEKFSISRIFLVKPGQSPLGLIVFFAFVILLTMIHLFGTFKGMSDSQAMQHAQQGRDILRGNGPITKVITPADIHNQRTNNKDLQLLNQTDTFSAPLYSYVSAGVLALVDGSNTEKYQIEQNQYIYTLDRVLAGAALAFYLIAIFINYFLAKRLFDVKIAKVTAILMLLSANMWQFVQSCLPQMFLLMVFSLVLYLSVLCFQQYELTGKTPWKKLALCAIGFGVLALTKWLLLWVFLGYLAFILIHFKPRGAVAALSIAIVAAMITPALISNYNNYGSPLGAAGLTIVNGMKSYSTHTEELMLRNTSDIYINLQGLALQTVKNCFTQLNNIVQHMGGIVVAPLFFLGLIHLYRRSLHNHIKWGVFLMWCPAVLGMAIFGTPQGEASANQLHLLFAPVMSMFGLSVVALFWSRLTIAHSNSPLSGAHFTIVILLSAGHLLFSLPQEIQKTFVSFGKIHNGPYYHPAELSTKFRDAMDEYKTSHAPIVYSDQPAAVAWYADTHAIWLPLMAEQFESIDELASESGITINGIHLTAVSTKGIYQDLTYNSLQPLVYASYSRALTGVPMNPSISRLAQSPTWSHLAKTYPNYKLILRADRVKGSPGIKGDNGHHLLQLRNKGKAVE